MGTRNFNTQYKGVLLAQSFEYDGHADDILDNEDIKVNTNGVVVNIEDMSGSVEQAALALEEMGGEFYIDYGYYEGMQLTFRNADIELSPLYNYVDIDQMVADVMSEVAAYLELEVLVYVGGFSDGTGVYTTEKPERV